MYFRFKLLGCLILLLITQSCRNAYRDFGDRSSDDFLIHQARIYLDRYDFSAALGSITPVLVSQPANQEVVYLTAIAYAGRAGLRVLDLFVALASDAGTKGLIQIFAEHFPGVDDTHVADIEAAINVINVYNPTPSLRPARINFIMTFLLFSRMGVLGSRYALDEDGVLNGSFDPCKKGVHDSGATGIPNAAIDGIIDSFRKLPDNIANCGSAALGGLSSNFEIPAPSSSCVDSEGSVECLAFRTLVGVGPTRSGIGFEVLPDPTVCMAVAP